MQAGENNPEQARKTIDTDDWHVVTIQLTSEQQAELSRLTGENVVNLKIAVENLADLSDLIAN